MNECEYIMNPISKAISDIKRVIPREVLNRAFLRPESGLFATATQSIDDAIRTIVIWGRVLEDTNLVGGAEIRIELTGMPYSQPDNLRRVYRIPKEKTGGRTIMSALNVSFGSSLYMASSAGMASQGCGSSTLTDLAQALLSSGQNIPDVSEASVQIIGENVIMVELGNYHPHFLYLRCVVSHDPYLTHLQLRSYIDFSKLCTLAVKAHVYTTLIVQMGDGQLQGGQQLGVFKDIVDEYRDANELYEEFLRDKWTKIMFMNDNEKMNRFVRSQLSHQR